ncbi:MAG: transglycosylase domain-containing protein [Aestuariivirgaceae bacterium]
MAFDADVEDSRPVTLARVLRRCATWAIVTLGLVTVCVAGFISIQTIGIWQQLPSAAEIAVHYTIAGEGSQNLLSPEPSVPKRLQLSVLAAEGPAYLQGTGRRLECVWQLMVGRPATQPGTCQRSISDTASRMILADLRPANTRNWSARWLLMTLRLERSFSRQKIFDLYIRHAYFGRGAYGVERAAAAFYGKPVGTLSLAQAAMLAGLLRSPARFDPAVDPDRAKQRRDLVIATMAAQGMISPSEGLAAQAAPLRLPRID